MKKSLVLLLLAVLLVVGAENEVQKVEAQSQADVMSPNKDEYPEIIPGG
ncbi:hypothetical protein M3936_05895 [Sutcliffiella horikoshii]|nr:hypothetical protein [Sutcliffiella horikoshii]MCM3617118.1 hypothetical protein [Sutcliffiella horikoshii]